MERIISCILFGLLLSSASVGKAQSIVGLHKLSQVDSTTFALTLKTDTVTMVTVHAAEDSTYRNTFIYLGKTVAPNNEVTITMDKLRNNTSYIYRIILGYELSSQGGTFQTGKKD